MEDDYQWLLNFFGEENIFEISKEEMYQMYSNVFSISEKVIISEKTSQDSTIGYDYKVL